MYHIYKDSKPGIEASIRNFQLKIGRQVQFLRLWGQTSKRYLMLNHMHRVTQIIVSSLVLTIDTSPQPALIPYEGLLGMTWLGVKCHALIIEIDSTRLDSELCVFFQHHECLIIGHLRLC